jgi:translation initiation factor IF-2
MSKIRIYELARELGVDNRVVITHANSLGFAGKNSHSHSLENDEAEQIRRAVIRQAMGGAVARKTGSSPMPSSEVITRRTIATPAGSTEDVVERRRGDVIMRRRQAEPLAPVASVSSPQTTSEARVMETLPDESPQIEVHNSHDENSPKSSTRSDALQSHELDHNDPPSSEVEEEDKVEGLQDISLLAQKVASDQEVSPTHVSPPESLPDEAIVSDNEEDPRDPLADTDESNEKSRIESPNALSREVRSDEEALSFSQKKEQDSIPPYTSSSSQNVPPLQTEVRSRSAVFNSAPLRSSGAQPGISAFEDEEAPRKAAGPKILGRMELPVAKKVVKPEAKKVVTFTSESLYAEDDGERNKGKGKAKRRELSRSDLVDYEGSEGRKSQRGRGGKQLSSQVQLPAEVRGPKQSKRVVKIGEAITVGELSRQMSLKAGEVIGKLMGLGVLATINQLVDRDIASIIAEEFGFIIESTEFDEEKVAGDEGVDNPEALVERSPVVTVMGHVDHGKTSLLDNIRKASVAAKEHGGITQHIGAYSVTTVSGKSITFIDTPGHEAFTAMRARGANVTDIVVLVVAADDGVMPQTLEAISHAQAAKVQIVVAINKMDKADANPDRIKTQLSEHGLQPEDWGGDTMYYPVSALKGEGIEDLLEGILLVAEVRELRADPTRRAKGTVIETRQDRGRGVVSTLLVQSGTLRVGDIFVCGALSGRIRSMLDSTGERLEEAGPSAPVEITGVTGVPQAGDDFFVVETEAQARDIAENRLEKRARDERALASGPISLEEFAKRAATTAALELNVILKTDVHGSLEALNEALERQSSPKVKVRVLHAAVGGINESDVQLARASQAIIIGFGVRGEPRALNEAEQNGVEIRFYRVIYEVLDDIRSAMAGLLPPVKLEETIGHAAVRDTFVVPKVGVIAGSYITDGFAKRGSLVRVVRDGRVVYEGKVGSLRRFKDDVRQVQDGYECGIGVENFNDVKVGDVLELFEMKEVAATLD